MYQQNRHLLARTHTQRAQREKKRASEREGEGICSTHIFSNAQIQCEGARVRGGCCRGVARVEARGRKREREGRPKSVCASGRERAKQSNARRGWHIKNGGFRRRQTEKKLPDEGVALSLGLPACLCVCVCERERKEKKI